MLVTPYIIHTVGAGSYGVYRTVASLSSSLMVVDLGLGGTVQRYIAKYISFGENKRKIGNFISMSLIPVSYTHLDVYKRQPVNHMSAMFRKSSIISAGSYMHLPCAEDYFLWVRAICGGSRTVSYTHLDVYKRQPYTCRMIL